MTFPPDDILSASGSLDRAVLLSERTQLIAIKAMQIAEDRVAWNAMSDAAWDEIEAYVGSALTEILTIQEQPMSEYRTLVRALNNQLISANTPTAIIWEHNTYDPSNPSRLPFGMVGNAIISVQFQAISGVAHQCVVWARINGIDDYGTDDADSQRAQHSFNLTWIHAVQDANDYVEIIVQPNQNTNIAITNFMPRISVVTVP